MKNAAGPTLATKLAVKLICMHAQKPLPRPVAWLVTKAVSHRLRMGNQQPTGGRAVDAKNAGR